MKVLGIGESVLDYTTVLSNQKPIHTSQDTGGSVLAALVLLARHGNECCLVTTLGRDTGGDAIRQTITQNKITLFKTEHHAHATKLNTITVDAQTGQRHKQHGVATHPPIKNIGPTFIQSFDMVIMDRHEHDAFYEVVRHKGSHTKLLIDSSTELSPFTLDMMRYADYPIVPIEALAQIGRRQTLATAVEALYLTCGKPLVVTMGEHGIALAKQNQLKLIPKSA